MKISFSAIQPHRPNNGGINNGPLLPISQMQPKDVVTFGKRGHDYQLIVAPGSEPSKTFQREIEQALDDIIEKDFNKSPGLRRFIKKNGLKVRIADNKENLVKNLTTPEQLFISVSPETFKDYEKTYKKLKQLKTEHFNSFIPNDSDKKVLEFINHYSEKVMDWIIDGTIPISDPYTVTPLLTQILKGEINDDTYKLKAFKLFKDEYVSNAAGAAAYIFESNTIFITEEDLIASKKNWNNDLILKNILRHEIGHFIDDSGKLTIKNNRPFSEQTKFKHAVMKDMKTISNQKILPFKQEENSYYFPEDTDFDKIPESHLNLLPFLPPNIENVQQMKESFAEVFASLFGGGGYENFDYLNGKIFPNTCKYIKEEVLPLLNQA